MPHSSEVVQFVYLHKYKKYDTIPIRHLLTLSDDTGGGRMANTEDNRASRTKSKNKYNAKAYDRFSVVVPKGEMQEIDRAAKEQGYKSRNEFVIAAINEKRGI